MIGVRLRYQTLNWRQITLQYLIIYCIY